MIGHDHRCCDVSARASAILDGELDAPEWTHLQRHLAACAPCTEYVRQLGLTVEMVRKLPGTCGDETRAELVRRFKSWAATR